MKEVETIWQSREVLAAALQAGATVVAVVLAYIFGIRHLKRQTRTQTQEDLRKRRADALQTAWCLLQSLTSVDNGRNLLR